MRTSALHVFNDAALIQSIEDAEYRFQSVEDMLRKNVRGCYEVEKPR